MAQLLLPNALMGLPMSLALVQEPSSLLKLMKSPILRLFMSFREKIRKLPSGAISGLNSPCSLFTLLPKFSGLVYEPFTNFEQ